MPGRLGSATEAISQDGASDSLLKERTQLNAIGLLFGGSPVITVQNHIADVKTALDVRPLTVNRSVPSSLDPRQGGVQEIRLTNTGQAPDTFDLQAAGILALAGQFSSDTVPLDPCQVEPVQPTADNLDFLLAKPYRVLVTADSQADDRIADQAESTVSLTAYEAVQVAWHPVEQIVNGVFSASFSLVITNIGNLNTEFQISGSVTLGGELSFWTASLDIAACRKAALPALLEELQGDV